MSCSSGLISYVTSLKFIIQWSSKLDCSVSENVSNFCEIAIFSIEILPSSSTVDLRFGAGVSS